MGDTEYIFIIFALTILFLGICRQYFKLLHEFKIETSKREYLGLLVYLLVTHEMVKGSSKSKSPVEILRELYKGRTTPSQIILGNPYKVEKELAFVIGVEGDSVVLVDKNGSIHYHKIKKIN